MRAVILAAGRGSRLGEHTDQLPKCLVPLAGRSLLARQLDVLRAGGVEDISLVAGYKLESIRAAHPELRLLENPAWDRTNMVSTLFCAQELMDGRDDLLVCYGDIVYEPRVLELLRACDAPVGLAINTEWRALWEERMEDPLQDLETLILDADGNVTDLGHKPSRYEDIQGQYMGLICFKKAFARRLPQVYAEMDRSVERDGRDFPNMYMTAFLRHLIALGWQVGAVPVAGGWLEVDSGEDLASYEAMHASGDLERLCRIG